MIYACKVHALVGEAPSRHSQASIDLVPRSIPVFDLLARTRSQTRIKLSLSHHITL